MAAGAIGLGCAALGLVTDQGWWAGPAGACAGAAGAFTVRLAQRLRRAEGGVEQHATSVRNLAAENDRMRSRADRFEAEARSARLSLSDVFQAQAVARTGPTKLSGIVDANTGLFNEQFFMVTLEKRVAAARRGLRPLAVVIVEVVVTGPGAKHHPADAKAVAGGLLETLRDADTASRMDDGRFALMLEDTPENGAVWTVERVRRRLAEQEPGQMMWAGVACYPAHAFDAEEIFGRACLALTAAKDWRQDRIEVAMLPEDER